MWQVLWTRLAAALLPLTGAMYGVMGRCHRSRFYFQLSWPFMGEPPLKVYHFMHKTFITHLIMAVCATMLGFARGHAWNDTAITESPGESLTGTTFLNLNLSVSFFPRIHKDPSKYASYLDVIIICNLFFCYLSCSQVWECHRLTDGFFLLSACWVIENLFFLNLQYPLLLN